MKTLISLTLPLIMLVTCLAGISFAADPVATIVTGSKVVEAADLSEVLAAIDPSGNSIVTLKADLSNGAQIVFPYSCTIDLNGHKISTTAVIVQGRGSVAVAIYETDTQYNDANFITGCTIISTIWGAFGFNHQTEIQTGVKCYIENSKLISSKEAGSELFSAKMGDGTVILGKGVEMYSYKPDGWQGKKTLFEGETVKAEFALGTVEIPELNTKLAGLSYWHTPEYVAAEAPAAPAQPEVPAAPAVPEVPTTTTPDVTAPTTGVSVVALGVMAMVSLAGAVITKKH